MRKPIFVRALRPAERQALERGLRSREGFVLRRCQMVLASAAGERAPAIARRLGCDDQTVRDVLVGFNERGLDILRRRSNQPQTLIWVLEPAQGERLRNLLHQSPRPFGKPTSVWTLALAAEVSFEKGLTAKQVSGETIRNALKRLGVSWKRAKRWLTSPDPEYTRTPALAGGAREKTRGTA